MAHIHQLGQAETGERWIPMLASPYLSPQSRAICTDHDVAYLDLVGNTHPTFGDVYIDRAVAGQPKSETRAPRSIFAPNRDGGPDIDVAVEFLMPREAKAVRNATPLVSDFAAQRADGADLALRFHDVIHIEGTMPDGVGNRVRIVVASIPALLAMKGYALGKRLKYKDAYDIYYCVRNFPGGLDALVAATSPLLNVATAKNGYLGISEKFRHVDDFGPTSLRRFVETSESLGKRTADQWQQDALGQIRVWLAALGLM